jgi:hypothetical protein
MIEQNKRIEKLDEQLDKQLTETIKLVRKLGEVTENNTLILKKTRFLIERKCL